jgi:undecaprenyl pyrophosphate phosphatase UppP
MPAWSFADIHQRDSHRLKSLKVLLYIVLANIIACLVALFDHVILRAKFYSGAHLMLAILLVALAIVLGAMRWEAAVAGPVLPVHNAP